MSANMPDENPSFETRLHRRTAESFDMPARCGRRACRHAALCLGSVSAAGEPSCIEALEAHDRSLFAGHTLLLRNCLDVIRAGDKPPALGNHQAAYLFHRCLRVAITAFADLPVNRAPLRQRLRRMALPSLNPPPRGYTVSYYGFAMRGKNAPKILSQENPETEPPTQPNANAP